MARLAGVLYHIGTPQTLEAVLAKRDVLPAAAFAQAARHHPDDAVAADINAGKQRDETSGLWPNHP